MRKLILLMLLAYSPMMAQSVKPRIKIVSDTSNGCQQVGTVSWEIYDAANDNATLSSGTLSITATTSYATCYKAIRSELNDKLQNYTDTNNILEPGGSIPVAGMYRGEALYTYRLNDTTTGTQQYFLTATNNETPPKVLTAPVASSEAISGMCVENCGTTGTATVLRQGDTKCWFDGATTVKNFVVLSPTVDGKCHDTGINIDSGWPTRGRIVAISLSTQASAGLYPIYFFPNGTRGSVTTPLSSTGKILRDDGTWVTDQTGSGSTPSGTGFRRIVGGVEDAAASEPDWAQITSKPSTFTPSSHSHAQADITNLVSDLSGKSAVGHTHVKANITDFAHTHPQSEITNLVSDLAGKQAALGFTPENSANKNAANGYAGLSAGSKVSAAQMTGVLASSDLTNDAALEKTANKGAANGYASLSSGLIPRAQLCSGTADSTTFCRGDGQWAVPAGGGGGAGQLSLPIVADAAGFTWTNMPAALTFLNGSHRFSTKADLTSYTQVRIIVNKQGTAGAASSKIRLLYRTAFDATVANWLTIGASEVEVAVNVTNTVIDSGWINLVAGAKADVFLTVAGISGDGVLDPIFGSIVVQFK